MKDNSRVNEEKTYKIIPLTITNNEQDALKPLEERDKTVMTKTDKGGGVAFFGVGDCIKETDR